MKKRKEVMKNKRGAEMTIGTIIIIILAVIVLVVIIYGFTTGWGNLWQRISSIIGTGKANIQSIVDSCKVNCASDAQTDYCKVREVYFKDGQTKADRYNCEELVNMQVGLDSCPLINCAQIKIISPKECVSGWSGEWKDSCGDNLLNGIVNTEYITLNDRNAHYNQYCCVVKKSCEKSFSGAYFANPGVDCKSGEYNLDFYLTLEEKNSKQNQKCCLK